MNVPIHREGYPFIALFAGVNLLAFLIAAWLGILLLPLTIWCIAFFRDPERMTPSAPGLIICPADGVLLPVIDAVPPEELGLGPAPRPRRRRPPPRACSSPPGWPPPGRRPCPSP